MRLDAFGAPANAAPGSAHTATSSIQTMTELGAGLFVDVAMYVATSRVILFPFHRGVDA